eukprot:gene26039-31441_t
MGASSSKEEVDESGFINDPRYVTWDQHGNLIYGMAHPVSRKQQLKEILELDFIDEEEGKQWYVVSSAWVASWLAYVHFAKTVAPCPGPCDNNGPSIYMYYKKEHKRETGEFDPALWVIEDPPLPPDVTAKKKKNRGKKQKELQDKLETAANKTPADEATSLLRTSEGEAGPPAPSNISSLLTKNEPKTAGNISASYAKVTDSSKPRNSSVLEVGGEEDVAKKRES